MKKTLSRAVLVPAAGVLGVALATSALGAPAGRTKVVELGAPVVALAIDGSRVAYGVADNRGFSKGKPTGHMAQVHVWNVRSGTTTKVSKRIAMSDVLHVTAVSIAGSRVAWLSNAFGNTESDNYLFTSSTLKQTQKHVATALRFGDACGAGASGGPEACAGPWLGVSPAPGIRS